MVACFAEAGVREPVPGRSMAPGYATLRPQVMQNFQATSSSVPQAGHCRTVRFCPQCGQNVIVRPSGSSLPQ